jgi:ribosomal-protein-alanine N-acetyltransferase
MQTNTQWLIRQATQTDYSLVRRLLAKAYWLHKHLDWVDAMALLDRPPFLLAMQHEEAIGCLVCPPDTPSIAWIRLFAVSETSSPERLWEQLWPAAADSAVSAGVTRAAALLSVKWFAPILEASGFMKTNDVVFLEWMGREVNINPLPIGKLRPMQRTDLPHIAEVDQRAFRLVWQYTEETLNAAFGQAAHATVIEVDQRPIAYQITTASMYGAHLARLAVDPDWQRHGIGKILVSDVLRRFSRSGNIRISVNTQVDNLRSLQLYEQLGFYRTDATYPVYEFLLE